MTRYEVERRVRIPRDGDSYIVIDMRRPSGDRIVAELYGDLKDALKNAEAFCFMKNMWQTSD